MRRRVFEVLDKWRNLKRKILKSYPLDVKSGKIEIKIFGWSERDGIARRARQKTNLFRNQYNAREKRKRGKGAFDERKTLRRNCAGLLTNGWRQDVTVPPWRVALGESLPRICRWLIFTQSQIQKTNQIWDVQLLQF